MKYPKICFWSKFSCPIGTNEILSDEMIHRSMVHPLAPRWKSPGTSGWGRERETLGFCTVNSSLFYGYFPLDTQKFWEFKLAKACLKPSRNGFHVSEWGWSYESYPNSFFQWLLYPIVEESPGIIGWTMVGTKNGRICRTLCCMLMP